MGMKSVSGSYEFLGYFMFFCKIIMIKMKIIIGMDCYRVKESEYDF